MAIQVLKAELGHQDMSVKLFGSDVYGCTEISVDVKDGKKYNFANGKYAVSFGSDGNYEVSGEISLLQSEYAGFIAVLNGKTFVDAAPTDMIVTMSNLFTNQSITRVFKGTTFEGENWSSKTGEGTSMVKIKYKSQKLEVVVT